MKPLLAKFTRKLLTMIILSTVMLLGTGLSSATSPFFENLLLTIPRIDVEGYGPMTVVLKLEDESTITFGLFSAASRDTSITPTATFDVASEVLSIPTVKVDDNFYDVQLQYMPGDTFQLTVANDVVLAGAATYQQLCSSCHGSDGTGISAAPLVNCTRCGDVDVLIDYIDVTMPLSGPGNCVGQCAVDIADFVRAKFNSGS